MTRRKRTPPPDSPRKRVAFEIPDSLAQLSALSRSLAQHADIAQGVDKEAQASDIVARAQALSNSPSLPEVSQLPKPIRWKTDQKDFPNAQTWIQPSPKAGSKGHATLLENHWKVQQARELAKQAEMIAAIHGHPAGPMAARKASSGTDIAAELSPTLDNLSAGQKRKRSDLVRQHQRDISNSQPWPTPIRRNPPKTFNKDIEERRQAIIAQLMAKAPVSVSSPGTNVQIPTQSPPTPAQGPVEEHEQSSETLDLAKDSSQIAALIAKKRAENAASGHVNRLMHLQVEHRHRVPPRQSWPGAFPNLPPLLTSGAAPFQNTDWAATPSSTVPQSSATAIQTPQQSGYAEVVAANTGDENTELDLRSLFSSPGPSPHPRNGSKDAETARALQNVINSQIDPSNRPPSTTPSAPSQTDGRGAASPSAQLLSSLAHVSSDALAELQSQDTNENQGRPIQPPPPPFPANKLTQLSARKATKARTATPQAQAKVAATLTPQQREIMLRKQQAERDEKDQRTNELRRVAEEKARAVQAENQRRHEQNLEDAQLQHQQQGQMPTSHFAHSSHQQQQQKGQIPRPQSTQRFSQSPMSQQSPMPQQRSQPPVVEQEYIPRAPSTQRFSQSPMPQYQQHVQQQHPQPSTAAHSIMHTAYMQPPYWTPTGQDSLGVKALMYSHPQANSSLISGMSMGNTMANDMFAGHRPVSSGSISSDQNTFNNRTRYRHASQMGFEVPKR